MISPAALVRTARHRAGLTQRQLAARARTSAAAVNRYERGVVDPSSSTLQRLLDACGMSLELVVASMPTDPTVAEEVRMARKRSPEQRLRDLAQLDSMRVSTRRDRR